MNHLHRTLLAATLLATTLLSAGGVAAATAPDPLRMAIGGEDWPEVERLAAQRLQKDPGDAVGLHGLAALATDFLAGSSAKRVALLPPVAACVAAHPDNSLCQLTYAELLMGEMFAAMAGTSSMGPFTLLDKAQAALESAVSLDPGDYEARQALVVYYLQIPGMLGGSTRKAKRNAEQFARIDAERGKLLGAAVALQNDDAEQAAALLRSVQSLPEDVELSRALAEQWLAYGFDRLQAKHLTEARAAFAAAAGGAPSVAAYAHLGLGRAALEAGNREDAMAEFSRALTLQNKLSFAHYRLAQVWEASGDKTKAAQEYQAFLVHVPQVSLDPADDGGDEAKDARDRLQRLAN